ncbi:MAG TPA: hypothetical protein VJC05_03105 [Candidatus Andersenbacteria bacterium]|nr:hypothetical protein [Candidatus Andersenbacteria bacterium]
MAKHHFVREGFEAEVVSTHRFNVISLGKQWHDKGTGHKHYEQHLPASAETEVTNYIFRREDVTMTETIVKFRGAEYDLLGVRNGLDGMALVIEVSGSGEQLSLYTDTPSAKPDHEWSVTPAQLREWAREASIRAGHGHLLP